MIAVCIDPGYDDTGLAIFHVPDGVEQSTPEARLRMLQSSHTLSTLVEDPPQTRLRALSVQLDAYIGHIPEGVEVQAYFEMPARDGDYGRTGKRNRASVNKLYMAIGALLATLARREIPVTTVKALTTKKEQRHEILELLERTTKVELPRGPRGGIRHDEWDAIMVGVTEIR